MRPISGKELCRKLHEAGWQLKRIKGSHHIFGKAGEWKLLPFQFTAMRPLSPDSRIGLQKTQEFPGN
jgi:hypothetical protein